MDIHITGSNSNWEKADQYIIIWPFRLFPSNRVSYRITLLRIMEDRKLCSKVHQTHRIHWVYDIYTQEKVKWEIRGLANQGKILQW